MLKQILSLEYVQPFTGGGVICGAKHEVVETGLGENLALVGGLSVLASGVLLYFAKRNQKAVSQA